MKSEKAETSTAVCAICQSALQSGEAATRCPDCHAEYHQECWDSNGCCAVYGCPSVPTGEARSSVEVPVAYWGQEYKLCPSCNQQIMAAAVRCRHCGTVFDSAKPVDSGEFARASAIKSGKPRLQRFIVGLFVFCLVPLTAPVAAAVTWVWRKSRDEDIRSLPALYSALLTIGCAVAVTQTAILVLVAVIYRMVHT
jgi:hypothetical protein